MYISIFFLILQYVALGQEINVHNQKNRFPSYFYSIYRAITYCLYS
jgi:hypothetical protein